MVSKMMRVFGLGLMVTLVLLQVSAVIVIQPWWLVLAAGVLFYTLGALDAAAEE